MCARFFCKIDVCLGDTQNMRLLCISEQCNQEMRENNREELFLKLRKIIFETPHHQKDAKYPKLMNFTLSIFFSLMDIHILFI
jgi:hypothetical protein